MALETLVDRFGQQAEDHEEVLASCVDAEGQGTGIDKIPGVPRNLDW